MWSIGRLSVRPRKGKDEREVWPGLLGTRRHHGGEYLEEPPRIVVRVRVPKQSLGAIKVAMVVG